MNVNETKGLFLIQDIELAWERVLVSVGPDVKDYFGINIYETNQPKYLSVIFDELNSNNYAPTKPFKYFEPKKCGTQRTKTVLNIKDAIVYQAIANKIGELVYEDLAQNKDSVYGSVLNENVAKGVGILDEDEPDFYFFEYYVNFYNRFVKGVNNTLASGEVQYKLETDITGFFDCIPHSVLLLKLLDYGLDKNLLNLLASCLNTWSGTRDTVTLGVGIPQGPPASFLLANILLDELDDVIVEHNLKYFRFMDDIRVYAPTEEKLQEILVIIDRNLKSHSLSVNTSKTKIRQVDSLTNEREFELDGSGIAFDEELLKNQDDLIILDKNQHSKNVKAYTKKSKSLESLLILIVEKDLFSFFEAHKELGPNDTVEEIMTVRHFLTLSQKWRSLALSLKAKGNYSPNKELIKVWLFGIEHIYWKTNSMVWNLNFYCNLESYSEEYERLLDKLKRFEWVKYQLLSIFFKVYPKNPQRHSDALKELGSEKSPLVRLGYYSVLVESIKENSSLFERYSQALKSESEEYVKEAILSSVHYKNTRISIDSLREWFLK